MNREARRAEKRKRRGAAALAILTAAMLAAGPLADEGALAAATEDLIVYGGGGGGGGGSTNGGGGGGGGGYIQLGADYSFGGGGDGATNSYSGSGGSIGGGNGGDGGDGGSVGSIPAGGGHGYVEDASSGTAGVGNSSVGSLTGLDTSDADPGTNGGNPTGGNGGNATASVTEPSFELGGLTIIAGNGGDGGGGAGGDATVTAIDLKLYGDLTIASGANGTGIGVGGEASVTVSGKLTAAGGTHDYRFKEAAPDPEATAPPENLHVDIGELELVGNVTMSFEGASFNTLFPDPGTNPDTDLSKLTFKGGTLKINTSDPINLAGRTLTVGVALSGEAELIRANPGFSGTVTLNAHPNQTAWRLKDADGENPIDFAADTNSINLADYEISSNLPARIYAVFASPTPPPTQQNYIEVYGIQVPYTIDSGGIVSVNLDNALLDSIVKAAMADNKDNRHIGFDFTVVKELKGLTVSFPPSWFGSNRDISLVMLTGIGSLNVDRNIASKFPAQGVPGELTLRQGSLILAARQGGNAVTWDSFKNPVVVYLPYTPKSGEEPGTLALFNKKTGEIVANSFYKDGRVYGSINRPGEYDVKAVAVNTADIPNNWANSNVIFAVSHGLLDLDHALAPEAAITRADFVTALCKLSGANVSGYTESSFADVADNHPAMPYIEWGFENGVVLGIGDDMFAPDASIAREEAATMMGRYADATGRTLPKIRLSEAYSDQSVINSWAVQAVAEVQRANVITGKPGNIYDPRGDMTHAEAAAILHRFTESVTLGRMGWVQSEAGGWLYIRNDHLAVKGWFTGADGSKYWFNENGIRAEGIWVEIEGAWYYFFEGGKLATDTTIDGYTVDKDGKRLA